MKNMEAMKSALKNLASKHLSVHIGFEGSPGEEAKETPSEEAKEQEALGLAPDTKSSKGKIAPDAKEVDASNNKSVPGGEADGLPHNGPMESGDADISKLESMHKNIPSSSNKNSLGERAKEKIKQTIMAKKK